MFQPMPFFVPSRVRTPVVQVCYAAPAVVLTCVKKLLVAFLFLVAMPGAPSSVLAPSSKARNPEQPSCS